MSTWQPLLGTETPTLTPFPACALVDLSHYGLIRISEVLDLSLRVPEACH